MPNVRISNRDKRITRAIAITELLNVTGLDFAVMVDNISVGINHNLGKETGGIINLGETERDEAITYN